MDKEVPPQYRFHPGDCGNSVDSVACDVPSATRPTIHIHVAVAKSFRLSVRVSSRKSAYLCQDVSVSEALTDSPRSQVEETRREAGVTLVELIITVAILAILATAALPVLRIESKREKERELRQELWAMRAAIDRYKDAADRGAFLSKVDSYNYPPDLQTLVDGVDVQGRKIKFLRSIPTDPMTGKTEWGEHSVQDDPDSDSFGGQNLFDVYSKATGQALDGTSYSSW